MSVLLSSLDREYKLEVIARPPLFNSTIIGSILHQRFNVQLHPTVPLTSLPLISSTLSLQTIPKKTYLCPTDFDEPYFDFSCLNGSLPEDGSNLYTICGTPYGNGMEHIVMVVASSLFGLAVYYQLLYRSGPPSARTQKMKKA